MSTTLTATYKNVQVVREFVRQLYGFDKGKVSTFIIVNYKYKLTLSSHGRRGFLTSPKECVELLQ